MVAFRGRTSIESDSHFSQVDEFATVRSFGLAGSDEAFIFDSEFDDQFVGRNSSAWVQWNGTEIDQAFEFETVNLVGNNGGTNRVFASDLSYALNRSGNWI